MGYRHTSRRNSRPRRDFTRAPMANKYAGECIACGQEVKPGEGLLGNAADGLDVRHQPSRWAGSPVSGKWVGGCGYYNARAAQDAAYESYRGNIAWTALCDEGQAARLEAERAASLPASLARIESQQARGVGTY